MSNQKGTVHDIAVKGFGEGTNDLYDKARPSYPAPALQIIAQALASNPGGGQGLTILEPGAGTGIFSRLLLSPPDDTYPAIPIRELVGVEPSEGMRAAWERGMTRIGVDITESQTDKKGDGKEGLEGEKGGPVVRIVDGSFEDFSLSGLKPGSVDCVVIAQAWHWCPDYDRAFREISTYLKPSAPLILIWNLESQSTPWHRAIREHYQPYDRGTPQYWKGLWRRGFETPGFLAGFEEARKEGERSVEWVMRMDEDMLVDRLLSKSYLTEAHLSGKERQDFIAGLREIIRRDDKDWVDREKGIFNYGYTTDVIILRRKA